jgi:hypothetical protein
MVVRPGTFRTNLQDPKPHRTTTRASKLDGYQQLGLLTPQHPRRSSCMQTASLPSESGLMLVNCIRTVGNSGVWTSNWKGVPVLQKQRFPARRQQNVRSEFACPCAFFYSVRSRNDRRNFFISQSRSFDERDLTERWSSIRLYGPHQRPGVPGQESRTWGSPLFARKPLVQAKPSGRFPFVGKGPNWFQLARSLQRYAPKVLGGSGHVRAALNSSGQRVLKSNLGEGHLQDAVWPKLAQHKR